VLSLTTIVGELATDRQRRFLAEAETHRVAFSHTYDHNGVPEQALNLGSLGSLFLGIGSWISGQPSTPTDETAQAAG
jgi:hypothetical protein